MDSTGQFASVLRQAASSSSFLAVAHTLVFTVTPVNTGESGDFSASATASTLVISILLCWHRKYSHCTICQGHHRQFKSRRTRVVPTCGSRKVTDYAVVLELSATERTFSIHFAVALILGIVFTKNSHYTHDKLRVALASAHGCCQFFSYFRRSKDSVLTCSENNKTYISMLDDRGEQCLNLRRMWV